MNVGQVIREKRLAKNMTQQELADRVQITQSMLCQIERGSKIPTILLAWEIAKVLDFELNDYVSEKS
ncbi:anaerobic benzoate catabolism transcriptional regulator [uncultured Ruminococcus sp.]|uniref:Helix-turn-helix transcriptional regulator n=1 Tax=Massiliimalia timonensis TaxID=1987501 RepID=A0A8J6P3A9_9FIRM|nr:helix-turn-helix transcriptional regulator [Massiliimalia timonensis]MBC8610338.1 helix-turn-helix transcriptional regulator [Massiliimalia timonensis]SCH62451.1 anaerobic benzoate catabolism transcriptional regulator [uncultured Clostridium sp.]SCH77087.1 anaerobic benzoate catabolism transcriptional regulator [uncultured Ruminococcus sp.]